MYFRTDRTRSDCVLGSTQLLRGVHVPVSHAAGLLGFSLYRGCEPVYKGMSLILRPGSCSPSDLSAAAANVFQHQPASGRMGGAGGVGGDRGVSREGRRQGGGRGQDADVSMLTHRIVQVAQQEVCGPHVDAAVRVELQAMGGDDVSMGGKVKLI